jgi:hypothetical protein
MKANNRMKAVEALKWPENRLQLALLSLSALQAWYAAQDPKDMIYTANTPEFKRFWHFAYVLPTRFYRKLLKIKHFAFGSRAERLAA